MGRCERMGPSRNLSGGDKAERFVYTVVEVSERAISTHQVK